MSMKIVEEPSSFGMNNMYQPEPVASPGLAMRVTPSNFSGPPHLRQLYGRCFTKIDDAYKYELCPFNNVTQHEQSLRWNPYSGVLGVWQEWDIENNTFQAMVMREGDTCGSIYRSMKVLLICGKKEEIDKVTEPQTCQYQMTFRTPLVCHPHSLLVYPTLSQALREKWDWLEGEYLNEEITLQGYRKKLRAIFEEAGYMMPAGLKMQLEKQAKEKETAAANKDTGDFQTLGQCKEEYRKLKEEIDGLRTLLAVYQSSNTGGNKTNELMLEYERKRKADANQRQHFKQERYGHDYDMYNFNNHDTYDYGHLYD